MEKFKYLITYSKTGGLKYISHLDLIGVFDRALRRAELPVYYTQGFNQKIKMSFSAAHAVGAEVTSDVFAIYLLEETEGALVADRINAALPKGICVHYVTKA